MENILSWCFWSLQHGETSSSVPVADKLTRAEADRE